MNYWLKKTWNGLLIKKFKKDLKDKKFNRCKHRNLMTLLWKKLKKIMIKKYQEVKDSKILNRSLNNIIRKIYNNNSKINICI